MKNHELLTSEESQDFLRVSQQTLANWRVQKIGPPYIKLGGKVLYRISDLEEWLDSRLVRPSC